MLVLLWSCWPIVTREALQNLLLILSDERFDVEGGHMLL